MSGLTTNLRRFHRDHGFVGKGSLCVALVVTSHAMERGLPLNPDELLTRRGGQVLRLGRSTVQTILKRHGIKRVFASEGGRTNPSSIGKMRDYVSFLNTEFAAGPVDLSTAEAYWVERVSEFPEFFAAKPFKIRLDPSLGLRAIVQDILSQAEERRRTSPGTQYVGAVMQHLVGAKLDCAVGVGKLEHNSFSTSDAQTGRAGDFRMGDVAIHVTSAPGDSVIGRCKDNLNDGLRPILVTTAKALAAAEFMVDDVELGGRIDVFGIEQFIALNLYELGHFTTDGRRIAIGDLIDRYNEVVKMVETDHSICIDFKK